MGARQKSLTFAAAALAICGTALAEGTPKVVGTPSDSGVDDQRIICKKHLETGSLVKRVKKCFTKAEWDLIAEREQVGFKKTMDALNTRSISN